jgi:hypothetical protein
MMPAETVLARPNGLPIASTQSPTRSAFESPSGSAGSSRASILRMAMSVGGSVPMIWAR